MASIVSLRRCCIRAEAERALNIPDATEVFATIAITHFYRDKRYQWPRLSTKREKQKVLRASLLIRVLGVISFFTQATASAAGLCYQQNSMAHRVRK